MKNKAEREAVRKNVKRVHHLIDTKCNSCYWHKCEPCETGKELRQIGQFLKGKKGNVRK